MSIKNKFWRVPFHRETWREGEFTGKHTSYETLWYNAIEIFCPVLLRLTFLSCHKSHAVAFYQMHDNWNYVLNHSTLSVPCLFPLCVIVQLLYTFTTCSMAKIYTLIWDSPAMPYPLPVDLDQNLYPLGRHLYSQLRNLNPMVYFIFRFV